MSKFGEQIRLSLNDKDFCELVAYGINRTVLSHQQADMKVVKVNRNAPSNTFTIYMEERKQKELAK